MYIVLSHWHVLWFVRAGVMALLLVTATQRKTYHQFPVFFTFLSWIGLSSIIMLWMDYAPSISTKQYDNAYEIEVLGETALGFMVLYELLRLRLQHFSWRDSNPCIHYDCPCCLHPGGKSGAAHSSPITDVSQRADIALRAPLVHIRILQLFSLAMAKPSFRLLLGAGLVHGQ